MKLFRRFRLNQIEKHNLKKYLLYAVGEVFLVMIGISLAFQVDNWNNNRIKQNSAIGHYKNINSQLKDDKKLLEQQITFNQSYLEEFRYASKILITNDRTKMDTLGKIMRNMTQYSDFDKKGNLYETLLNSGEIKLLKNTNIVNGLHNLEENYNYLNRMEMIHYNTVMDYVVKSTLMNMRLSTGEIMEPDAIYTYQFENLIISLLSIMNEKQHAYNQAHAQISKITQWIDAELKN